MLVFRAISIVALWINLEGNNGNSYTDRNQLIKYEWMEIVIRLKITNYEKIIFWGYSANPQYGVPYDALLPYKPGTRGLNHVQSTEHSSSELMLIGSIPIFSTYNAYLT